MASATCRRTSEHLQQQDKADSAVKEKNAEADVEKEETAGETVVVIAEAAETVAVTAEAVVTGEEEGSPGNLE